MKNKNLEPGYYVEINGIDACCTAALEGQVTGQVKVGGGSAGIVVAGLGGRVQATQPRGLMRGIVYLAPRRKGAALAI